MVNRGGDDRPVPRTLGGKSECCGGRWPSRVFVPCSDPSIALIVPQPWLPDDRDRSFGTACGGAARQNGFKPGRLLMDLCVLAEDEEAGKQKHQRNCLLRSV